MAELAVGFLSSAGLPMLIKVYGKSQHDGVGFAVVTTSAAALRPLQVTGLNHVLPLTASVEDASASVRPTPWLVCARTMRQAVRHDHGDRARQCAYLSEKMESWWTVTRRRFGPP